MRIAGINCEYKKLTDYLSWCETKNVPIMSDNAKSKIKNDVNKFISKSNIFCAKFKERITAVLKNENPAYYKINNESINWSIFAFCINAIKPKLLTGEFCYNIYFRFFYLVYTIIN